MVKINILLMVGGGLTTLGPDFEKLIFGPKGSKNESFGKIFFDHKDIHMWLVWSTQTPLGEELFDYYGFFSIIWLSGHTVPVEWGSLSLVDHCLA